MSNLLSHLTLLIGPILMLCVLGVVLLLDYFLRIEIYKRADPFSFSILFYSLVLVVTDLGVKLVKSIKSDFEPKFLAIAASYIVLGILVYFIVKRAHEAFMATQEQVVIVYLDNVKKDPTYNATGADDVWKALKRLGRDMIQPDAFRTSKFKREKRVEFLVLVKELTNATMDPSAEQSQLLVNERGVKYRARAAYVTAITFGIVGTLVLLLIRLT